MPPSSPPWRWSLTPGPRRLGDAVLLCLLGLLCVRSYETMVYLGPLVAAAIVWSMREDDDRVGEGLMVVAAVASSRPPSSRSSPSSTTGTIRTSLKVRAMSFDFWQNLQFVIPLVGLAISAAIALLRPSWLQAAARRWSSPSPPPRSCSRRGTGWSTSTPSSIRRRTISRARRRASCWRCCSSACGCTSPGSVGRPRSSPSCACPRCRAAWCWP